MTLYIILAVACVLNAAMDSIDHNKRSLGVYELWHIIKSSCLGILIIPLIFLFGKSYFTILIVAAGWVIVFETSYYIFNSLRIYQWDDVFKCKLIRMIYTFKRK